MSCETPTKEEIRRAVGLLKSYKAADSDGFPAEDLKADLLTSVFTLYAVLGNLETEGRVFCRIIL